jgi:hypothetical protein
MNTKAQKREMKGKRKKLIIAHFGKRATPTVVPHPCASDETTIEFFLPP